MSKKEPRNQLPGNMSSTIIGNKPAIENGETSGDKPDKQLAIKLIASNLEQLENAVLHGELTLLMQYFEEPLKTYFEKKGGTE